MEQFTGDVEYKYYLLVAIVLNAVITFCAEKLIAQKVTEYFDKRTNDFRLKNFSD